MGKVPEWFKELLVMMRGRGYWFVTKEKAKGLAFRWFGKSVTSESVARYIRWSVEEGYLRPAKGSRGRGIYYLTGKVAALVEIQPTKDLGEVFRGG
jgi:hypothetical protein